eukprot:COSAG01_NODE_23942_length_796_cov_0.885222_1_plen_63_part_10
MNQQLRSWSPNCTVVTDCGAVTDMMSPPVSAKDNATAAAYALMNGTDFAVDWAFARGLLQAVQ